MLELEQKKHSKEYPRVHHQRFATHHTSLLVRLRTFLSLGLNLGMRHEGLLEVENLRQHFTVHELALVVILKTKDSIGANCDDLIDATLDTARVG